MVDRTRLHHRRRQIVGHALEDVDLLGEVAGEDEPRLLRHVQELVRVARDRIGKLDPVDEGAVEAFLERLRADGRVFISPSRFLGRACIRFAILNWRTSEEDLDIAADALSKCRRPGDEAHS